MSYASSVGLPDVCLWTNGGNPLMDLWYNTRAEAPDDIQAIEARVPEEIVHLGMPVLQDEDLPDGWISRYPGGWEERISLSEDCGDPNCMVCRWDIY